MLTPEEENVHLRQLLTAVRAENEKLKAGILRTADEKIAKYKEQAKARARDMAAKRRRENYSSSSHCDECDCINCPNHMEGICSECERRDYCKCSDCDDCC